jgi:hypothetical protein
MTQSGPRTLKLVLSKSKMWSVGGTKMVVYSEFWIRRFRVSDMNYRGCIQFDRKRKRCAGAKSRGVERALQARRVSVFRVGEAVQGAGMWEWYSGLDVTLHNKCPFFFFFFTRALKARRVGAKHMVEAGGTMGQDATRALKAQQVGAKHVMEASGTRGRGAARQLKARRVGAEHMVEASGGMSRDATRALQARRVGAKHMVGASGARSQGAAKVLEARRIGASNTGARIQVMAPRTQPGMLPKSRCSSNVPGLDILERRWRRWQQLVSGAAAWGVMDESLKPQCGKGDFPLFFLARSEQPNAQ